MKLSEVHSYLNSFTNFESQLHKLRPEDFNLNRIKKFLDLAGYPAQEFKDHPCGGHQRQRVDLCVFSRYFAGSRL